MESRQGEGLGSPSPGRLRRSDPPAGRVKERVLSPLSQGEVAERSEVGEGLFPLPQGEVAERSEVGEGISYSSTNR